MMDSSANAATNQFLKRLLARFLESERRSAAQEMRGKVTDVDPKRARARVQIGVDDDGQPVKTPWLPYKQIAGAMKIHQPPSVGQTMSVRSASGDVQQGVLEPFHWSDDNPANSEDGASNVMTFGDVTVTVDAGSVSVSIGGLTAVFSGAGLAIEGGEVSHNGRNIGSDHQHSDVEPGGSNTGPPVA